MTIKTIILCGGLGTRLGIETKKIPKPMVKVNGIAIIEHIIKKFVSQGYEEFILATGYKHGIIEKYFKNKRYKVKCVFTGERTNTGGRILKLKKFVNVGENFFLTYGDGISNQNLNKTLKHHKNSLKIGTITTVRPPARFGEVNISNNNIVKKFKEKPNVSNGWINGGYFVFNYKIFDFIKKKNEIFESEPLERLVKQKQLTAFKHKGLWQCMDTPRDKKIISNMLKKKKLY
jgi:glucose-1-phosphate cytidylyltransferase|tara:strand:+ start:1392 stop:2087 length:696 start_codon:yes stop_codon:yes gene_type:complete